MPRRKIELGRGELVMYLDMAGWHRARAAKLAGVSRETFQRRMREHRVRAPRADSRLDPAFVERLRSGLGCLGCATLAETRGVSRSTIARARRRETWF